MFESLKKKLGLLFGKKEQATPKDFGSQQSEKLSQRKVEQKGNLGSLMKRGDLQKPKGKKQKPAKVAKKSKSREIKTPLRIEQTAIAPVLVPDIEAIEEKANELEEVPIPNRQEEQELPPKPQEKAPEEKEGFFSRLVRRVSASTLTEEEFNSLFEPLELELLESNVALDAVDSIKSNLKKDLVGIDIKKGKEEETVKTSLKEAISTLLKEPPNLLQQINKKLEKPYVIVAVGINGTGKTTTLAKLANYLKSNKLSVALAAADTFRSASIEQLEKHASALKVPLIKKGYNSDPASVAFEAIQYSKKNKIDVLLIDTAGRMHTNSNLMREIEKIVRVSQPDLKLFIGEAITGNDSIEQAKAFDSSIGIDGSILTKAELDEKSGAILSIAHITSKPIFFLGTGQSYKDLTPFSKSWFLKQLNLD